uniref:Uncharacterized protein n=1 Tax=Chenopodium quinoa TaxID=63459 RepID=A0A803KPH1_CHEQI
MEDQTSTISTTMKVSNARLAMKKIGETFDNSNLNVFSIPSLSEQWSALQSSFSIVEASMASREKELESKEREIFDALDKVEMLKEKAEVKRNELELWEKSVKEKAGEVEMREKEVKQSYEVIELKKRQILENRKKLEGLEKKYEELATKEKEIEERRRVLEMREEQLAERCNVDEGFQMREKEMMVREQGLDSRERRIRERMKELELKEKEVNEGVMLREKGMKVREEGLDSRERRIRERMEELELKEKEVNDGFQLKEKGMKVREEGLGSRERRIRERMEELELKEKEVNEGVQLREKEVMEREEGLGSRERRIQERMEELELKRSRKLNEQCDELEMRAKRMVEERKVITSSSSSHFQFSMDSSRFIQKKQKQKQMREHKALRQRHTAKRFINKVLKDLPPQHKDAINDLGFGGFLHLTLDAHNGSFSEELVNSFDPDRTSLKLFNGKEILITEEDVHVVYGLPQGPVKIKEPRTNFNFDKKDSEVSDEERKEREDNSLFLRQWRSQFGPAINCCVMSTDNTSVNFKFLCSCKDITKVSKLDWCLFTKQSMTEAVRKWKKGSSYFTGPLPFMMDYFAQFSTMAATLVKKFSVMYAFISMFEDVQIQKELKTIIVDKMYKYTDPAHVFDESAFMAELNEALSNIQAKNNQNEPLQRDEIAKLRMEFCGKIVLSEENTCREKVVDAAKECPFLLCSTYCEDAYIEYISLKDINFQEDWILPAWEDVHLSIFFQIVLLGSLPKTRGTRGYQ